VKFGFFIIKLGSLIPSKMGFLDLSNMGFLEFFYVKLDFQKIFIGFDL